MSQIPDTSFIPDLPKGPLCKYRNRAKFDWKKLKLIFESEQDLRIKYKVWKVLENDPLFSKHKTTLPIDEQKHLCAMQVNRMPHLNLIPKEIEQKSFSEKTKYLMSINEALHTYCPSLSVKIALGVGLFNNAIRAMGTERHMKYYDAAWNRELITCLAITELAHGSNTKRFRTTATYDPKTQEFVVNTPDFESAKCWVGNLGKTATIALTFANLYTENGENHGLHGFIIPIRNPKTLQAYPGVLVGDMGEKIGLNGIDNGFVIFSNCRIPRENLLNRTSDVTQKGEYESVFSEPGKVLGAALESFSAGRIGIMQESANTLASATVIAVRYAALRKQFGPEKDGPEVPIIEYQLQQWRIFPYLAAAGVLKVAVAELTDIYLAVIERSQKDSNGFELLTQIVSEIHAVISSSKPLTTWTARDAIQEAREACGGHGYLKASKLGDLRNDHDPSVTYEGDNNVLGQQASNWLLRQWTSAVESPVGTVNFLKNRGDILQRTYETILREVPIESMDFVLHCYEWMLCYLLDQTSRRVEQDTKAGVHRFDARNNAQVYGARDLSLAYAEYFALSRFSKRFRRLNLNRELSQVLNILFAVYAMWCIDRHMTTFYLGGFAKSPSFAEAVRTRLLSKCGELKDSAVSVADALAPPDFALNSVIAKSDGLLYENLQSEFMTNQGAFERPAWWKDIIIPQVKSKL
ncbi:PREDICTED: peroxisomal acyl-coenzyme A oxidase 3 [Rhagoletis zephyria]|uniref:peroxisomal acyl-coenzyme A oxidase 3 n=1 Tax=Rhagoletis zephyria TaxID=28612 RepID=UPI000811AA92|nr:PREDICTED: peroxisomal acyl-coenzyme A oxidase 3 [Rhagoletis zephyria]XP_036320769.1 peroxisomal acyl-coenzyme A oxidase 3 [Rhagoletis pomonella]XP_036320770.1 peroxisomal acyl-coenzyme A oxidase 3 [Rhagoletis pomonella]